jgi:multidrug transporter EmrE-like cation transporter
MLYLLILMCWQVFTSRASGGGFGAKYLDVKGYKQGKMPFNMTWLPEAVFAIPYAVLALMGALSATTSIMLLIFWFLFSWFISYICMQTSHGETLESKFGENPSKVQDTEDGRDDRLAVIIRWICNKLKFEVGGKKYCFMFWFLKGALIALPLGVGYMIFHGIFWMLAYYLGYKVKKHAVSEMAAGAGSGVVLWMALMDLIL